MDDVQCKWDNYISSVTLAYHHYFPLKEMRTHPSDAPWMTPRIKRLLQQRNRAFYCADDARFRSLRNRVCREITAAKKNHYPRKIEHLKQSNNSEWYSKVKSLCGMNRQSCPYRSFHTYPLIRQRKR